VWALGRFAGQTFLYLSLLPMHFLKKEASKRPEEKEINTLDGREAPYRRPKASGINRPAGAGLPG
jgi:hypothetical protein